MYSQRGFTYIAVLAALTIVGILAGKAQIMTSAVVRAERESELLFRGQAYQRAIQRYYEADHGFRRYPTRLEDLIRDPRFIHRRHLRALYSDPIGDGWLLIPAPDGGIMGVASSSEEAPVRTANFPEGLDVFAEAESYQDWTFVFFPNLSSVDSAVNDL